MLLRTRLWTLVSLLLAIPILLIAVGSEAAPGGTYLEENGILVMEAENGTPETSDKWVIVDDVPDHRGEGFIRWEKNNYFNDKTHGILAYKIKVTNGGNYILRMRSYHNPAAHGETSDQENDCWTNHQLNSKTAMYKTFRSSGQANTPWTIAGRWEPQHGQFKDPVVNLPAGEHTFRIAARSKYFMIDRIYLVKNSADLDPDLEESKLVGDSDDAGDAAISGELKKWHKVTLTFDGPNSGENANPNPFTDYRMTVTFTNGSTTYVVPGYFAADGDAANSSATSGNKWRVHFAPDKTGTWTYTVSFREGSNVAVNASASAGSPVSGLDGKSGSFNIQNSDKGGRDFRGKGMLRVVGGHYLQFAESGEYFLKQGADAPENFLAYEDFDNTPNNGGRRKNWNPHVGDWQNGDPTWNGGKGKGIIGAVNYLASEGMNAFSFIPMNIGGDDKNVFPYISDSAGDRTRMDCSKLDQWEKVFEQADKKGMFLHFKTQETENELLLDNGNLGNQRKLYYRELIARFGHHLALNWNLGEEINNASTSQKKAWAQYFHDTDPYRHHVVIHNGSNHHELMGSASKLTGFSLQTSNSDFSAVHSRVKDYLDRSDNAGKPWAVACDEPGDASHALRPDNDAGNSHEDGRKNGLWGTFMAGGWGNEWYFGYQHDHSDLTCQDFRSRNKWWDYCRYALEFFDKADVPFWEMKTNNGLSSASNDYCFFKKGVAYVVYLKNGGSTQLDLSGVQGSFNVNWYDPRNGGNFKAGSVTTVNGGGKVSLGNAPNNGSKDWVILVTLGGNSNVPPTADAGADQTVTDSDGDGVESVTLDGSASSDTDGSIASYEWTEGGTILSTAGNPTLDLAVGNHVITLTVTDNEGAQDSDSVNVRVNGDNPQDNAVVGFTLIDADSDSDIAALKDGDIVNLAALPTRNLSVRADTNPAQVSTVQFTLTGATTHNQTEGHAPYALWGDTSADYKPGAFNLGDHNLEATPTLNGDTGSALQINFTVIDESSPENNPPVIDADPVAEPATVTLPEMTYLTVAASDPEGDALTYNWSVKSGPGDVSFEPNGTELSDRCDADFSTPGEYVLQVTVSDGEFNVAKTVAVTVLSAQNNPPVAKADAYQVEENTSLEVAAPGLLGNDTDADGDRLTAISVTEPANGQLFIEADGAFSYTPDAGFVGTDSFTYLASDGDAESEAATVTITVTEGTPVEPVAVIGFTLINADSDEEIMALEDGATLNLNSLSTANLSIRADTDPEVVGQVSFSLKGATTRSHTEKVVPYALWGDTDSDYEPGKLNLGSHTLTATPYVEGTAGGALTIEFTVVDEASYAAAVTGYTLINADTNKAIKSLKDGETLTLSQLPDKINIRANTEPNEVAYVVLALEGATAVTRTEKVAPYALWGDKEGNYYDGALKPGNHTLVATPYLNGNAEQALTIEFKVVK